MLCNVLENNRWDDTLPLFRNCIISCPGIPTYTLHDYHVIVTRVDDKDDLSALTPDYTGIRDADLSLGQSVIP
jgi:hypothetical protein